MHSNPDITSFRYLGLTSFEAWGFLVRSAYFLEMEDRRNDATSSSGSIKQVIWKRLWGAHVPAKVKLFGRREIHDGIAPCKNMFKRGMAGDRRYLMCGEGLENTLHTLMTCPDVKRMWRQLPLRVNVEDGDGAFLKDWCAKMSNIIPEEH